VGIGSRVWIEYENIVGVGSIPVYEYGGIEIRTIVSTFVCIDKDSYGRGRG